MNRAKYLEIRKHQDLGIKPLALPVHIAQDLAMLVIIYSSWIFLNESPLRFLVIPILSVLIFRSFSLMHDCVHKAVSKNIFVNDLVGIFAGAVCLLPFEPWRRSHLEHHTWSGNLDKDPVTAFITIFPKFPERVQNFFNFFWSTWFPLLAIAQYAVFWCLATKTTLSSRKSLKIFLSVVSPIIFWSGVIAIVPWGFTLGALLPGIILYMVAVEVVNFPHHLQLPQHRGETRFPVWEQYQVSRSCIYPRWFARWVALNFNYHTEHHMFPDVPWYHLEKLHGLVKAELGLNYNSDANFSWILENKPKSIQSVINYSSDSQNESERRAS